MMSRSNNMYRPQICRLCLAQTLTYFSLINDNEVPKMLEALTTIRILSTDDISTVACLKCILNLKLAFATQQNMLKAEQRFRNQSVLTSIKQECDIQDDEPNNSDSVVEKNNEEKAINWICDICNCVKLTKQSLTSHKYNVHTDRKCPLCQETVKVSRYRSHMIKCKVKKHDHVEIKPEVNDTEQKFTCEICGCVKKTKRLLTSHKYTIHRSRKCSKCGEEFRISIFNAHVSKCTKKPAVIVKTEEKKDAIHTCDVCGVTKETKFALRYHKYSVHRHKNCTNCGKTVKSSHATQHLAHCVASSEGGPGKYTCDICGVVKLTIYQLKTHKYQAHISEKCPICGKVITKGNIKRHIERHKTPLIVCEICGKSIIEQDLKSHLQTHSNINYKCRYCDNVYKARSRRVYHENKEHLNKPGKHVCDTCGKNFHKKTFLTNHIASKHLKLRPYVCEFCNVGFSSKFALTTHRRQHTNETPFKCEVCGQGFRQNVSLKGHLRSKHGIEEKMTCECNVCGKKLASMAALHSHKRIH